MELQQLLYFRAVVETGSFTRAATQSGVSQPTLSQQIAKLERELGQALFVRSAGGVTLTDAGHAFAEQVAPALQALETARDSIRADTTGGRLVIAAIPTVMPYLIPPVVQAFTRDYPAARLELQELTTAECVTQLSAGQIDFAVLALPTPNERDFKSVKLLTEPLLLALPEQHPLALRQQPVAMHELQREPFVLLQEAHCLTGLALAFCGRHKLAPIVTARLAQLSTVLELVRLGQGLSLIPKMAQVSGMGVVYLPLAESEPLERTLGLVRLAGRFQSRLAPRFAETFTRVSQS